VRIEAGSRKPEAILSAPASKSLKRPVKVAPTRQQELHVATHRSDTIQRIRQALEIGETSSRLAFGMMPDRKNDGPWMVGSNNAHSSCVSRPASGASTGAAAGLRRPDCGS
jgi:hypothetical protein